MNEKEHKGTFAKSRLLPWSILATVGVCSLSAALLILKRDGNGTGAGKHLIATNQGNAHSEHIFLPPTSPDDTNPNPVTTMGNPGSSPRSEGQRVDSVRLLQLLTDRTASLSDRVAAADALGRLKVKGALEILQQILGDSSEPLVLHYKAARALGAINDEMAVPTLSALLGNQTTDRHLRVISALALGSIGTTSALRGLAQAENDSDSLLRFKIVQALENSRDATSRKMVENALDDSDIHVQARAIHTLGKLGGEASMTTVSDILHSTGSDFIRIACFTALADINSQESVSWLREYEHHTNMLLRQNARTALQRISPDKWNQP